MTDETDDDQLVDDDDDTQAADDDDDNDDDDTTPVDPFLNPEAMGPYLVGNVTTYLTDESRELSCGTGPRILMTEMWYPSTEEATDYPENYLYDFFLGRLDEIEQAFADAGIDPGEPPPNLPTGSYRDAPLNPQPPKMPLLIFSHGFGSNRFQNYTMAVYLASHGYLVVGVDHICNSTVTLTPDAVVLGTPINALFTLGERKGDMQFIIDVFSQHPPAAFAGRVDKNRVGLFGHSYGGVTVSETVKIEPRVKAILQMAAFAFPFPATPDNLTAASMYFAGDQDKVMYMFRGWRDKFIEAMPRPKYTLKFIDTGHFAFSDLCSYSPALPFGANGCGTETRIGSDETFTNPTPEKIHTVLDPYATAFFGAALLDYADLWAYLKTNHAPDMMNYTPAP